MNRGLVSGRVCKTSLAWFDTTTVHMEEIREMTPEEYEKVKKKWNDRIEEEKEWKNSSKNSSKGSDTSPVTAETDK